MSLNILPEGWVNVTLADICSKPQYGYTTKSQLDGNVKFLRTTDITKGFLDWDSVPYCEEPPTDLYKYQLYDRDIVISRAGSIGFSALIKNPPEKVVFASYLIRFKPSESISEAFIKHFLNSHDYWTQLRLMSAGNAVQNVNAQKLSILNVPLPPMPEQKIIADKLDDLLARVESIKTRLENIPQILKKFRQSVLNAAVTGGLSHDWRKENKLTLELWKPGVLADFIQKPSYGSSSKSQPEGKVPVLRMGNLQKGEVDWTNLVYTSDSEEIEKYKLSSGDVLFNRTNSPELVGKTSIYRGEREAIYAGYLIKIKCNDGLNADFLNYHLNSPQAKDYCLSVKSDGVSQSNINAKKLVEYPISVPPYNEQLEIVRRVERLFFYADSIENKGCNTLVKIVNLTQSILAKAFRGELTAQWREENPALINGINSAEALLQKIATEKLVSGTIKKRV